MKLINYYFIFSIVFGIGFSQSSTDPSIVTIGGSGTAATSAHITIGTDGYRCPDEYIIEAGASLTTWGPAAICGATIADQSISGFVKDKNNAGVKNVTIVFNNGGATVKTDATGFYDTAVPFGWSGTSTPSKIGYTFVPANYTYNNINNDQTDQDFAAKAKYVIISGHVWYSNNDPVEGVVVEFSNSGLNATTNADGYYHQYITEGWSGTATPTKTDHSFAPENYSYSKILTNQNNQDYVTKRNSLNISGHIRDNNNIGIEGYEVVFSNGGATVVTNATGHYSTSVSYGWNGTATPIKDGWTCTPSSYTYPAVTTDQTNKDYVGTDLTLAVEDAIALPTEFTVLAAYPNPFNPSTTLRYGLDTDSHVTVEIYDIRGKLITTLLNAEQKQGWHNIEWSGIDSYNKQIPAGIYLSRITSNNNTKTSKLMFLK